MDNEKLLVEGDYRLVEVGGPMYWTFAEIPDLPVPGTPFGMMKVRGSIDRHEFSETTLMPLGNGHIGLPVSAAVRKKIGKRTPDKVRLTLWEDNSPLVIPPDLVLCMSDEEGLLEKFEAYPAGQKRAFIKWIDSARREQTRADRIARTIRLVQDSKGFY